MSKKPRACLIYVRSTANQRPRVRQQLEEAGYTVCEVEATMQEAVSIQSGNNPSSSSVRKCIQDAEICVFLIPETKEDDSAIPIGAGIASQLGKRIVGIVVGDRTIYPREFETAGAIIRLSSPRIASVIMGENVWENPDSSIVSDRKIKTILCQ